MTKLNRSIGSRPGKSPAQHGKGAKDIQYGSAAWNAGLTYGSKMPQAQSLAYVPLSKLPRHLKGKAIAQRKAMIDGPKPAPLYRQWSHYLGKYVYAASAPRGAKGWERQAADGHWYKYNK